MNRKLFGALAAGVALSTLVLPAGIANADDTDVDATTAIDTADHDPTTSPSDDTADVRPQSGSGCLSQSCADDRWGDNSHGWRVVFQGRGVDLQYPASQSQNIASSSGFTLVNEDGEYLHGGPGATVNGIASTIPLWNGPADMDIRLVGGAVIYLRANLTDGTFAGSTRIEGDTKCTFTTMDPKKPIEITC